MLSSNWWSFAILLFQFWTLLASGAKLSGRGARRATERKCENRAWMAATVSIVEVIAGLIVDINRDLGQAQAEQARVEVEVWIWITGDRVTC